MSYLKFTPYLYLILGIYLIYDGISNWNTDDRPWMSFGLAAFVFFMFFFRRKYAKRFESYKKNNN
ncbi:hypothetical protein [Flavobacterium sp.]|uniref:hypothetical protein n=1 Tax=Flavobacterium sp. TaxID=239 RepID=UPI00286F86D0|nr:hypothetical protein [Flavobacterium sp.]